MTRREFKYHKKRLINKWQTRVRVQCEAYHSVMISLQSMMRLELGISEERMGKPTATSATTNKLL